MPLEEYRRKRDFGKTPEPAGDGGVGHGRRPGERPVRRPAPPGDAAALRLPARDRRRPRLLGRAEGPDARPVDPAHGRPRRGPPDRVLRLRGRHPARRVRRRRRHRLGLGHAGSPRRRRPTRAGRRATASSSSCSTARSSAAASRSSGRAGGPARAPSDGVRGRRRASSGCSSTSATTTSVAGLGRRGPPAEREDRPHERRGQGRRAAIWISRGARGEAEIDLPARSRRAMPRLHRADERDPRRERRSATPTGCSRSSGTATGSRRSSATARSGSGRATATTRETYFPKLLTPPPWIEAGRRSSTARSSRSTRTAGPTSACSRTASASAGQDGRGARSSTRRSTCSTSTGARCSTCRSRSASSCSELGPARDAARALRQPHRRRGRGVPRGGQGAAARGDRRQAPAVALRARPARRGWLKIKVRPEQELVVGGWTPGEGNAKDLGALVVGVTRATSCSSRARSGRGSTAGRGRSSGSCSTRSRPTTPPFDPPPPRLRGRWGGDLAGCRLDQARARDPRGARRLDPRRDRPPVGLQGHRAWAATRARSSARWPSTRSRPRRRHRPRPCRDAPGGMPRLCSDIGEDDAQPAAKTRSARRRRRRPRASERPGPVGGHRRGARRARRAGQGGALGGRRPEPEADEPRQGRCSTAATGPDEPPVTKRELDPLLRADRADDAAAPVDRPLNLHRFPNGAGEARLLAEGHARHARRHGSAVARDGRQDARTATPTTTSSPTGSATLCWLGNQAAFEIHAWTSTHRGPVAADVRAHRHRPRHEDHVGRDGDAGEALPDRARAPGRPRLSQDHRLARHPGLDPDRAEVRRTSDTSDWVEKLSRAVGATVPDLVSWEWAKAEPRRQGPPRLHAERVHQDARRAVRRRPARRRPGLDADRLVRARRPGPAQRPLDGPQRDRAPRSRSVDLFAGAQTESQDLPAL